MVCIEHHETILLLQGQYFWRTSTCRRSLHNSTANASQSVLYTPEAWVPRCVLPWWSGPYATTSQQLERLPAGTSPGCTLHNIPAPCALYASQGVIFLHRGTSVVVQGYFEVTHDITDLCDALRFLEGSRQAHCSGHALQHSGA